MAYVLDSMAERFVAAMWTMHLQDQGVPHVPAVICCSISELLLCNASSYLSHWCVSSCFIWHCELLAAGLLSKVAGVTGSLLNNPASAAALSDMRHTYLADLQQFMPAFASRTPDP
jgi:ABC-type transport system involved in cytochrome bd biosynthesis fused ATPase/permease subunit